MYVNYFLEIAVRQHEHIKLDRTTLFPSNVDKDELMGL